MKKILLLTLILFSANIAGAVNWQYVDTGNPNINMFIDKDSIRPAGEKIFLYAVRYQVGKEPEKVVYLKSDYTKNYLGVINAEDYSDETYRPNANLASPHVFMKPLKDDSFLSYAHKLAFSDTKSPEQKIVTKQTADYVENNPSEKPVAFKKYNSSKDDVALHARPQVYTELVDNYVRSVRTKLEQNWQPPKSGKNTLAKITLVISPDGELLGYRFTKLSGNKENDISIVQTLKNSAPFDAFPKLDKKVNNINLRLEFSRGLISKVVK